MRYLIIVLFSAVFAMPAQASECDNAGTQSEMNQCADIEFAQVDSQLNEAYQELREAYQAADGAAPALRAAQRAWVTFRDAECAITRLSSGGTSEHMVVTQCLSRLTATRLTDLRVKLSCTEGDLSCIQLDSAAD